MGGKRSGLREARLAKETQFWMGRPLVAEGGHRRNVHSPTKEENC